MLYAYSVKEPIGELNLKKAFGWGYKSLFFLLFPSFIFFSTGSDSRFWEFHPSSVILRVLVFSLSWSSVNPWLSMLNLGALYTLFMYMYTLWSREWFLSQSLIYNRHYTTRIPCWSCQQSITFPFTEMLTYAVSLSCPQLFDTSSWLACRIPSSTIALCKYSEQERPQL